MTEVEQIDIAGDFDAECGAMQGGEGPIELEPGRISPERSGGPYHCDRI